MSDDSEQSAQAPDPSAQPPEDGLPANASPYKNLWVPLVVVPFLVVGTLVLVYAFFGAIGGKEASLEENLDRAVHGGPNESQQALVSLASQLVANREALGNNKPEPFPGGPTFLERLQDAWKELESEGKPSFRFVVALALSNAGDPGARDKLESLLALSDEDDPQGELRFKTLEALAFRGDPASARAVIPFLKHPDPFLRQAAAAALQAMPDPESIAALKGVLDDSSLELRGMAAVSLSHLGDASGARVLRDLAGAEIYAAEHTTNARRFSSAILVQNSRVTAVRALARLGLPEDRALFERLASSSEPDPAVREAAMKALADL